MARFAVSDVHGCLKSLKMLLFNKMGFSKNDALFLLGDYINKGPDSKGVLDFIADLQQDGFQVFCIKGNHDQMLLDSRLGNVAGSWCHDPQKINTLKSFGVHSPWDIPDKYISQIASMLLFYELEHCFLVHAGFYSGIDDPFLDTTAMLNIKKFSYNASEMRGKKIIHGHVPQRLPDILKMTKENAAVIPIDGGCVYYTSEGYGNLIGLDIDTLGLFVQPNVDCPYEVALKQS